MENTPINPITPTTHISVSGLIHHQDTLQACVIVEDNDKSVEFRLPSGDILSRKGYSDEEIALLQEYLSENNEDIMNTAKGINPMKAFMS